MNCAHCATPLPEDSRFCLQCGSLVSDAGGQARASATMDASSEQRMERMLRDDTRGEYEIGHLLGKGGMAAVYLATEVRLGRKVAIKVLPPELTFGHGVERFVREAKTAAALDHPNIIPVYRITSGDTIFWYAMKFIEGRSLDDIVKDQGLFTVEETVPILSQVSDALDYAHKKQVIHRDVKPANVMIDLQDRCIVTDFGIAKALTEGTLTASGAAIGTPYYMSPEQAKGGVITGAADQYSLGIVAYRMLSGQLPFEGESAVEILHKAVAEDPAPLEVLRPGLPAHVYAAVARSLDKEPARRFPTIRDFARAMRGESGIAPPPPPRIVTTRLSKTEDVPAVKKPRGFMKIGVSVAVVAVIGAAAAVLISQRPRLPVVTALDTASKTAGPAQPDSGAPAAPVPPPVPADSDAGAPPKGSNPGDAPTRLPARLSIRGLPTGATVYVDGRRRPGNSFELRDGTHVVRMEADGFNTQTDTVALQPGESRSMTVQLSRVAVAAAPPPKAAEPPPPARESTPPPAALGNRGVLTVSVTPWANIALNGVPRGRRPFVDTLSTGTHAVTFTRDGFVTVDTAVTVRAGGQHRLAITMRPNP